jgi:hypothetical protein
MQRREFIHRSTAALTAGIASSMTGCARAATNQEIEQAARKVGQLPRRKLGYSKRDVSVLVGAADWEPEVVEAGVRCGVNFWHKANEWSKVPASILKNREAHYCQVVVDRVGGNNETGRIDEQEHYRFVKDAVKETGLGYFDDMQFHFGYHRVAEIKKDRGFIRAFERLKKEGLVRHLCLSQHPYTGNPRVPGGQSPAEILTAVVEDGLFEHVQFMYSYGDDPALDRLLTLARQKGFGTVAMKTSRGMGRLTRDQAFMKTLPAGTSPHHALARWLTTATQLDAAVIRINNLRQFIDTASGAGKAMRAADRRALALVAARADREACRLCNECMSHCPRQVPIADILRFERYALDNANWGVARRLYARLDRRADACAACGSCVPHCPQALPIPEKLARTHTLLS